MKKGMDKKAIALRSVLLLLLGLAAVAIVVIGVMGGFDTIFSKLGLLPGNLEVAAQSCGISATQNLETSYCREFKQVRIAGTKQYVTCDYLESHADFEHFAGECTDQEVIAKELCKTLKDNAMVNGKVCYTDGVVGGVLGEEWGLSKDHLEG